MIRALLAALPLGATLVALLWVVQGNPLAAPFVERTGRDLALTLEREVRRTATAPWLNAALAQSVEQRDAERAAMLITLSEDLERDVDTVAARQMIAQETGILAMTLACAACMGDIATCPSAAHLTFCAVPFEMSPLGDLNALRRASVGIASGQDVDTLDAGLALVGLGATAAVVVSGGSSATVKAGATLLRMARRIGSVTPELARMLRVPIRWLRVGDVLAGSARLEEAIDAAALTRVRSMADDLGRVATATSPAVALRLMRVVGTPEDAARLARVAEAAGPRTTRTFAVLGKGRVARATVRLSRAAAGTLVLIWLTALQIAVVLATRLGSLVFRSAVRAV